ncbi:MAG TPA: glycosyltransferase family 39 protein [Chloroflexia bacterium]|nr:glycosyltransferase family 39 protein [Chloroflexia bacterium]
MKETEFQQIEARPGEQISTPVVEQESSPPPPKPNFRRIRLFALGSVAWIAIIVAVWFVLHPLFNVEFPIYPSETAGHIVNALGSFGLDILMLGLCVLASAGAGLTLLRLFWGKALVLAKPAEKAIFSVGLGLGLNMLLVLGLGLLGGINPVVAYALLVIELALLWPWRGTLWSGGVSSWQNLGEWRKEANWREKLLVGWALAAAVATLLIALAPPLAWDALMYHLEMPKRYIEAGRIEALPRLGQSNFPSGAEMLFTWGMLLRDDGLAQAFSWLFGLLGAGSCLIFAGRFFPRFSRSQARQVGLLAAALYLSIPHVWLLMTWAYTDTMLTFYALLAFYALLLALEYREQSKVAAGWVALAGIMAGLSCSGKYTAVLAALGALAGVAAVGGLSRQRPTYRQLVVGALIFAAAGSLSFAPWLIRNYFFAGNPLAPLFGGIKGWEPEEIAALSGKDGGVDLSLAVVLGRPFQMVLQGRNSGLYDATLSPLFLALVPLGIWAALREKVLAGAWLAIGINYLGWLIGIKLSAAADHSRLILPVFPLLALITAYALVDFRAFKGWGRQARLLRQAANLAVGLVLLVSTFWLVLFYVANDPLPYHFGLQSRDERVENELGAYYRAAAFVNKQLPASANLFLFFEPRSYYFDRQLSPDHNGGGQFLFFTARYKTAQGVYDELKKRGATHALVNEELLNFLVNTPEYHEVDKAKAGRQILDDLLKQGYFEKLYEEKDQYTVYKLR